MIGFLRGTLVAKRAPSVLVDVGGVGYEVDAPMSTFFQLPEPGVEVLLFTHLVVREDAHILFGFLSEEERALFRNLIRVTGIGAKLALGILSGVSADEFQRCVLAEDTARLVRLPGIGKKTAERLLLELKGKLADALPTGPGGVASAPGVQADALNALLALGYSDKEAAPAIKQLPEGLSLEESIRQALKLLVRK